MVAIRYINLARANSPATMRPMDGRARCLLFLILLLLTLPASAQWAITADATVSDTGQTAYINNDDGYRLEIYRNENAVRSRFSLPDGLTSFYQGFCPTYQIDNRTAENTSIDGSDCLLGKHQVGYNFGAINNNVVRSSILQGLMDGIGISFRFRLRNGDYRETRFTLNGSKRAMVIAIGEEIAVQPR